MSLEFWNKQAEQYGFDSHAVNFDPIEEELESFFLDKEIFDNGCICDLGCGNGGTIFKLAEKRKTCNVNFFGFDFSPKMIEIANEQKKKLGFDNVFFFVGDATSPDLGKQYPEKFDEILTKRLLINVRGDDKRKVIENVHSMLRRNGRYVMTECFLEPLEKINEIRSSLGLYEIKVHSFNEYLTEDFLYDMSDLFINLWERDFGSLYYFISRIFNAALSKGKPDYMAPINQIAAQMSKEEYPIITGFAPETMIIFRKKEKK